MQAGGEFRLHLAGHLHSRPQCDRWIPSEGVQKTDANAYKTGADDESEMICGCLAPERPW